MSFSTAPHSARLKRDLCFSDSKRNQAACLGRNLVDRDAFAKRRSEHALARFEYRPAVKKLLPRALSDIGIAILTKARRAHNRAVIVIADMFPRIESPLFNASFAQ